MMLRRDFLRRLAVGAAGLLVADDALELLAEPRRFWPGADFASGYRPTHMINGEINRIWRKVQAPLTHEYDVSGMTEREWLAWVEVSRRDVTIPVRLIA